MKNATTSPAQHTPGPWRTDSIGADRVWILDSEANYLAEIVASDECGFAVPTDQQQANARLMAAAPDLLRELKLAALFLAAIPNDVIEQVENELDCNLDAENLYAAINKAEGTVPGGEHEDA